MESLEWLEMAVNADFPDLKTDIIDGLEVLHVWKPKRDSVQGLSFLPDFHLIFQCHQSQSFTLRLITFHGRTVDSIFFQRQDALPAFISVFLREYTSGFQICQGVAKTGSPSLANDESLFECLNDVFVARSIKCRFKLKQDSAGGDILLNCDECAKIATSVKTEPVTITKSSNSSSSISLDVGEVKIKKEQSDEDTESYNRVLQTLEIEDVDFVPQDLVEDDLEADLDYKPRVKVKKEPKVKTKKKRRRIQNNELDFYDELYGDEAMTNDDDDEGYFVKKLSKEEMDEYLLNKKPPRSKRGRKVAAVKKELFDPELFDDLDQGLPEGGKYKCRVCLKEYNTKTSWKYDLIGHAKFMDLKTMTTCPLCKEAVKPMELTSHFEANHSASDESVAKTICVACLTVIPNEMNNLRKHVMTQHHSRSMCETCGKTLSNRFHLEVHVKEAHSDQKTLFCDRCGKSFGHHRSLDMHIKYVCAVEECKCPLCAKEFSCKRKLKNHLVIHCDARPFLCRVCPYSSYKTENIVIHSKKVHGAKGSIADVKTLQDQLAIQKEFIQKHLNLGDPAEQPDQERQEKDQSLPTILPLPSDVAEIANI